MGQVILVVGSTRAAPFDFFFQLHTSGGRVLPASDIQERPKLCAIRPGTKTELVQAVDFFSVRRNEGNTNHVFGA